MSEDLISEDVQAFLLRRIDSIAELEALLLLRAHPEVDWTPATLAKRLYITPQETTALLEALCTEGFLVTTGTLPRLYRYHCSSDELARMVDRVADLYAKYLIPITNLIHTKSQTSVQAFADAFRLRKDG